MLAVSHAAPWWVTITSMSMPTGQTNGETQDCNIALSTSRGQSNYTMLHYRTSRIIMLAASSRKRNVTVWRSSVCLSRRHIHRDSLGRSSMRRDQRTFLPDNKKDRRTCLECIFFESVNLVKGNDIPTYNEKVYWAKRLGNRPFSVDLCIVCCYRWERVRSRWTKQCPA